MSIYLYLLILVCFLLLLLRINKKLLFLPFFVITIFSGCRYYVGIDYNTYVLMYDWGSDGTQVTLEPLFSYFIKICQDIGGTAQLFFLISAIITNTFVYLFIKKLSTNYFLSFLLYFCIISFYLYTFNATRQWLACSVFLYSLTFFKDKKYYKYFFLNILAGLTFHTSLFFVFPLTFIALYNIPNKIRVFGYIAAIALGFLSKIVLSSTMYDGYEQMTFDASVDAKVYIFLVISFLIEIGREKFIDKNDDFSKILVNINYISILLLIMLIMQSSGTFILLFKRLHNYFFAVYIIFIPYVINNLSKIKGFKEIISIFICLFLISFYIYTLYNHGEFNKLIPYNYNLELFR